MRTNIQTLAALVVAALVLGGCEATPKTPEKKQDLSDAAQRQLAEMTEKDPGLQSFLDKSHGYVIFPKVGKGGLVAGGAYGRGVVYDQGRMVGYADLTQATVGLQAGGQTYSEVLAFENKEALDRFKQDKFEFSANASAVILKSGAAAAARYQNGVAVFVMPRAGAMVEASVGGQKFKYDPSDEMGATTRPAM